MKPRSINIFLLDGGYASSYDGTEGARLLQRLNVASIIAVCFDNTHSPFDQYRNVVAVLLAKRCQSFASK